MSSVSSEPLLIWHMQSCSQWVLGRGAGSMWRKRCGFEAGMWSIFEMTRKDTCAPWINSLEPSAPIAICVDSVPVSC